MPWSMDQNYDDTNNEQRETKEKKRKTLPPAREPATDNK